MFFNKRSQFLKQSRDAILNPNHLILVYVEAGYVLLSILHKLFVNVKLGCNNASLKKLPVISNEDVTSLTFFTKVYLYHTRMNIFG